MIAVRTLPRDAEPQFSLLAQLILPSTHACQMHFSSLQCSQPTTPGLVPYVVPNGKGNTWLEVSTDAASVTQCFTLMQYKERISTY